MPHPMYIPKSIKDIAVESLYYILTVQIAGETTTLHKILLNNVKRRNSVLTRIFFFLKNVYMFSSIEWTRQAILKKGNNQILKIKSIQKIFSYIS